MKRTTLALTLAATLAACAPRPDAIAPVPMTGAFDGISCTTARAQLAREQASLATLSRQQNDAATADAIGIFVAIIPISTVLGGDKSGEIAATKGKIDALETRISACG